MFFGVVVYTPLLILNIFFSSNNLRKCQDNIFLESSIFPERYSDKSFVLNSLLVFAKSTIILLTFILLSLMVRCKDSQILAIKQIYCQDLTYYYTVFRYQPSRFRTISSISSRRKSNLPFALRQGIFPAHTQLQMVFCSTLSILDTSMISKYSGFKGGWTVVST